MPPVRLAVVEDRDDLRATLLQRLALFDEVEVVLASENGAAFLADLELAPAAPEVVLMDIEMPEMDGVEATRRLKAAHPQTEVVMLTVFDTEARIAEALVAGASGYLLKEEPADRIVSAVLELRAGGAPVSARVARTLVQRVGQQARQQAEARAEAEAIGLTPREREVLGLIARGDTDDGMAAELGVSTHTVQTHVKSLYRKLAVHSRGEAARRAVELGLA
ncbi:MAG TPA: response regulator transcription factor [Bacteroidetes bacterium]|nr:response regulator transcription factor [Bacteroidota bacterium]